MYQTYDVTALLMAGENAIGALLAPGWYETPLEWFQQPNNYGDTPPALRAQIRIEHTDGSCGVDRLRTASMAGGAHRSSGIPKSTTARARTRARRNSGWNTPEFDASSWKPVTAIEPKPVAIEAQDYPVRFAWSAR